MQGGNPASGTSCANALATVRIRPLTPNDAAAYKALRDEALRTSPDAFTTDHASAAALPASAYAARFGPVGSGVFFLGAFDTATGRLLGCVGCEREARVQQRHIAHVVGMMVTPAAQRRGIGRQLIDACVQAARHVSGLTQLLLTVTASNAHAVRLYERAGFRAWGLLPRAVVVDGVGHDKLHMLLLLLTSDPQAPCRSR